MNLQEKLKNYKDAETKVIEHCLCLEFVIEPHYFFVYLPHEIRGIQGVRIEKSGQKTKALNTLFLKLEKLWRLDNEVLYPDEKI